MSTLIKATCLVLVYNRFSRQTSEQNLENHQMPEGSNLARNRGVPPDPTFQANGSTKSKTKHQPPTNTHMQQHPRHAFESFVTRYSYPHSNLHVYPESSQTIYRWEASQPNRFDIEFIDSTVTPGNLPLLQPNRAGLNLSAGTNLSISEAVRGAAPFVPEVQSVTTGIATPLGFRVRARVRVRIMFP